MEGYGHKLRGLTSLRRAAFAYFPTDFARWASDLANFVAFIPLGLIQLSASCAVPMKEALEGLCTALLLLRAASVLTRDASPRPAGGLAKGTDTLMAASYS